MENQNQQITTQGVSYRSSLVPLVLKFCILLTVAIVFSLLGLWFSRLNQPESKREQVIKEVEKIVPKDFVIPAEKIADPIYSDWGGRVKGKVSKIENNIISISPVKETYNPDGTRTVESIENGQTLDLIVDSQKTKFYESIQILDGAESREIVPSDLKNGDLIEGGVEIVQANGIISLVGRSLTRRQ